MSEMIGHTEDCEWRTKNNVLHKDLGFGKCECNCHQGGWSES